MYNTLNYWHGRKLIGGDINDLLNSLRASQQKVKHDNRRLNFGFYMRNKKSK